MKNNFTVFEESFINKLSSINVASISTDKRVADYLNYLLQHKKYFLKIYSFVLEKAISCTNKKVNELNILDFGTGNGLLALYAKHCGCKQVFACDVYSNFIVAAKKLSELINIEIDDWSVCDEYNLFNTFSSKKIDIIVGTDVIEHIYDLDIFYKNIRLLNNQIVTSFTTASVYDNYFKRKKLEQLMISDEVEYVEIRKNIIHKYDTSLNNKQLDQLSKATRGLKEEDIINYVDEYKRTGIIKNLAINDFNTCDPITGNFTERILTIEEYKILYRKHHLGVEVLSGFYNDEGNILKKNLLKALNFYIKIFYKKYIIRMVTPFVLLVGNSELNNK
jgi:2-polyprenyl-3-methyl-5-hydroxy-6-metoxy-1,4-benzoquinol methylase